MYGDGHDHELANSKGYNLETIWPISKILSAMPIKTSRVLHIFFSHFGVIGTLGKFFDKFIPIQSGTMLPVFVDITPNS